MRSQYFNKVSEIFELALEAPDSVESKVERVSIVGSSVSSLELLGSTSILSNEDIEQFKFDDIGQVLTRIPGVNIRQEDGYGLRPNIGFRGVTPNRSKKINILEDGILIGPAPYSAPAAYYFPLMSKIQSVEVTKGLNDQAAPILWPVFSIWLLEIFLKRPRQVWML